MRLDSFTTDCLRPSSEWLDLSIRTNVAARCWTNLELTHIRTSADFPVAIRFQCALKTGNTKSPTFRGDREKVQR